MVAFGSAFQVNAISCPAGSGLVAFAAATGVMPLDMPESVLVRFKGEMQPGITLRDLVHAIPLYGIKQGMLTVEKKGKINEFSGRILEIEGLEHLTVEQAFELSDASAERSAAGCTINLSEESVAEYLRSNITMLRCAHTKLVPLAGTRRGHASKSDRMACTPAGSGSQKVYSAAKSACRTWIVRNALSLSTGSSPPSGGVIRTGPARRNSAASHWPTAQRACQVRALAAAPKMSSPNAARQ